MLTGKGLHANKRYLIPASVYIVLSYTVMLLGEEVTAHLADEDGFFENLGAIAFLVAAYVFTVAFFRLRRYENRTIQSVAKGLICLGLALALFFAAGEEISWGQRIVGLETPESIRAINIQDETNIHNLDLFQVTPERNILRLSWHFFWLMFTLGIPLIAMVNKSARRFLVKMMPVIPWTFGILFLANYLIWRAIYVLTPVEVYLNYPEEIMESNLAVLFVVVSIWIIKESIPTQAGNVSDPSPLIRPARSTRT